MLLITLVALALTAASAAAFELTDSDVPASVACTERVTLTFAGRAPPRTVAVHVVPTHALSPVRRLALTTRWFAALRLFFRLAPALPPSAAVAHADVVVDEKGFARAEVTLPVPSRAMEAQPAVLLVALVGSSTTLLPDALAVEFACDAATVAAHAAREAERAEYCDALGARLAALQTGRTPAECADGGAALAQQCDCVAAKHQLLTRFLDREFFLARCDALRSALGDAIAALHAASRELRCAAIECTPQGDVEHFARLAGGFCAPAADCGGVRDAASGADKYAAVPFDGCLSTQSCCVPQCGVVQFFGGALPGVVRTLDDEREQFVHEGRICYSVASGSVELRDASADVTHCCVAEPCASDGHSYDNDQHEATVDGVCSTVRGGCPAGTATVSDDDVVAQGTCDQESHRCCRVDGGDLAGAAASGLAVDSRALDNRGIAREQVTSLMRFRKQPDASRSSASALGAPYAVLPLLALALCR